MTPDRITLNTYYEYMSEAFDALSSGMKSLEEAENLEDDDGYRYWLQVRASTNCRYAFLLAANALEAAANALLLSLEKSSTSYSELERLPTLLKFDIFCLANGAELDRGNMLFARIKDVVKCRNEFVHPKPKRVTVVSNNNDDDIDFEILVKKTNTREFPTSFTLFEPNHSLTAIGDILAFLSWVVFDVCAKSANDGIHLIGYGSFEVTGDALTMCEDYSLDSRSFNAELQD